MSQVISEAAEKVEKASKLWENFINHEEFESEPQLSRYQKRTVSTVLENTRTEMAKRGEILSEAQLAGDINLPGNAQGAGNVQGQDHVLFSLIRRVLPKLLAFDVVGVQPMTGPTGLIFSLKSHYSGDGTGDEALTIGLPNTTKKADTTYAGTGGGLGLDISVAEKLGTEEAVKTDDAGAAVDPIFQTSPYKEMSFSIEKTSVEAKTRALKATYTLELAQDLKAIHGLDAEEELSFILSNEIVREIDRELIDTLFDQARPGYTSAGSGTPVATFQLNDAVDNLGARWGGEKIKALVYRINREAHAVALASGRGAGNFIITSANVATALDMVMGLDVPSMGVGKENTIDPNKGLFGGVLGGRYRVYIDPSLTADDILVGYSGESSMDNGWYYCPYTPLEKMKAFGENDFQPRIGYKMRYGMKENPFSSGTSAENNYYRKFTVTGLNV